MNKLEIVTITELGITHNMVALKNEDDIILLTMYNIIDKYDKFIHIYYNINYETILLYMQHVGGPVEAAGDIVIDFVLGPVRPGRAVGTGRRDTGRGKPYDQT